MTASPLERDPFFGPLHRAHPDVDVVLLPPLAPAPVPDRPAAASRSAGRDAMTAADQIAGLISSATADIIRLQLTRRWSAVAGESAQHRPVCSLRSEPAPADRLRTEAERIGDLLLAHGFEARLVPGSQAHFVAIGTNVAVEVWMSEAASGSCLHVVVAGPGLVLDRDDLVHLRWEVR